MALSQYFHQLINQCCSTETVERCHWKYPALCHPSFLGAVMRKVAAVGLVALSIFLSLALLFTDQWNPMAALVQLAGAAICMGWAMKLASRVSGPASER